MCVSQHAMSTEGYLTIDIERVASYWLTCLKCCLGLPSSLEQAITDSTDQKFCRETSFSGCRTSGCV